MPSGVGGLSTLLATVLPPSRLVLPGWAYSVLPIVMWRYGAWIRRGRSLLEARRRSARSLQPSASSIA